MLKWIKLCAGACIAGAMITLACAPFNLYLGAILSPSYLLYLWHNKKPAAAFYLGFWYGVGLFGSGVYWLFISIHTYGQISSSIAVILTSGFIAYLALFPALQGYILQRFWQHNTSSKFLAAFPVIWVSSEWIRSWLFTGFPWLNLGYSQIHNPALRDFAPILSVYGVSLATIISSGLLFNCYRTWSTKHPRCSALNLVGLIGLWLCGLTLHQIVWTKPCSTPFKVSLVQANVPQEIKWQPQNLIPTLRLYLKLTQPLWSNNVIIWPEAAIPIALNDSQPLIQYLTRHAIAHQSSIITGIPVRNLHKQYYNAVIALGNSRGTYFKQHLVPFGEYIPMQNLLGPIFKIINLPLPDLIPNPGPPKLLVLPPKINLQPVICYEIAFPEQILAASQTSNILLTITNDGWFGHSIAAAQHLQIAQMRSLELGKPGLIASNNGPTAFIDAHGQITAVAPKLVGYVLTSTTSAHCGITPWQRYGMKTLWLILGTMLLISRIKKRYN